ncbi:MAG: hypothetical protein OEW19_16380, partial [Acidobacteriota bacterium]|nr:hypothetical protein [Acidobacteriota bacterium]
MSTPSAHSGDAGFHVLTVGLNTQLVREVFDRVEATAVCRFSHIMSGGHARRDLLRDHAGDRIHALRDDGQGRMPAPDPALLASLEQPGVPTIHNMIMGDPVARHLPYHDALVYATHLAHRFADVLGQVGPDAMIGGFDGMPAGLGLAVARRHGVPWFSMHFSAIPPGLSCFCTGLAPATGVSIRAQPVEVLRQLAETTLDAFVQRRVSAAHHVSAYSPWLVLQRLPRHATVFASNLARRLRRRADPFTERSLGGLLRDYARKRRNMLTLPSAWFCSSPPLQPYIFFGLHMQPESSIDVWAPFFADQFNVIEQLARSTPPSHQILVKLHRSDADNYSRAQLDRLRRLPGVRLVGPRVLSRPFIERAALVATIQGTMGLEAALLGRPVMVFGDSKLNPFPTVTQASCGPDLPATLREALACPAPDREAIVSAYMAYLSGFLPGCFNDWTVAPTEAQIAAFADQFRDLRR